MLTPFYLINIAPLIKYLQLYNSDTVLEKRPFLSTIGLLQCFKNVLEGDHSAALFISFIEIHFILQCVVNADLVECEQNVHACNHAFVWA